MTFFGQACRNNKCNSRNDDERKKKGRPSQDAGRMVKVVVRVMVTVTVRINTTQHPEHSSTKLDIWKVTLHVKFSAGDPGTLAWQRPVLIDACQSGTMATLLNSLFSCLIFLSLPQHCFYFFFSLLLSSAFSIFCLPHLSLPLLPSYSPSSFPLLLFFFVLFSFPSPIILSPNTLPLPI